MIKTNSSVFEDQDEEVKEQLRVIDPQEGVSQYHMMGRTALGFPKVWQLPHQDS